MIQLSKNIAMFAASQTKRFLNIEHVAGYFYVLTRSVVSNDIRLSNPCSCCSSAITVSWSRWEAIAFLIFIRIHISLNMTKRNEICNAGNNSTRTATSAHETCAVSLTGNPYQDLGSYGFDLHRCTIRYHQSPNNNGNTITGDFNISGRIHTAGATGYAELIGIVVQLRKAYQQYVSECHKRKRDRNRESWLHRHPEYTNRITNIYINITGNNNTAQLGVRNLMSGK